MPIAVADYDPAWPDLAEQAETEILAALPGLFSAIEHIGSSSLPGLAAKPIIDLMAATADLSTVMAREADLRGLGYEFHDAGMPGHLFFRRAVRALPGRITCTSSRPRRLLPATSCCSVITSAAILRTRRGMRPSSGIWPRFN